jgi:Cdc6-like AAA superfamily ATPase
MSLVITEEKNKLEVKNSKNNLDKLLAPDIPYPLPSTSGFSLIILGSSGSGKTTLLNSIVTGSKKKGKRTSYLNVFDFIYIISPTLGGKSMKNDKFATIPEDQIYRELTLEVLTELEDKLYKNREDDKNSLVIMDDIGSQLRRNAKAEKKLVQILQNRRHSYSSFITLLQKYKDAPTGYRSNLSHAIFFRPKNRIESEAISNELLPFDNKKNKQILDYVFENENTKFPFLMIDMSLKNSNRYLFFNGFNALTIDDDVAV